MNIGSRLDKYNFEFRHIAILFFILMIFEVIVFFIFKNSLESFIFKTEDWYQRYSSTRIANGTANSLEMLIETIRLEENVSPTARKKVVQKFDILLNQHLMEKDIEEVCLFIYSDDKVTIIDDGETLYKTLIEKIKPIELPSYSHKYADSLFQKVKTDLIRFEKPYTIVDKTQAFHSFIPFVPDGEFTGVLYVRNSPDFSSITDEFVSNYNSIAFVFSLLIMIGLFLMYLISSYTIKKKETTQFELYEEKQKLIQERIEHEKEFVFTKRIYHANHKAEKVIGFINRDIEAITENMEIKERITKYTNFIGRIIYDMKWYDPPLHSIRNQIFNTNLNEVIKFIVDNLFLRLSVGTTAYTIQTDLDEKIPILHVNEFVIWEILEPLIQNSLTHNSDRKIAITIKTHYDIDFQKSFIYISDDGKGISCELLEVDSSGVQKIFLENTSSKEGFDKNFGYGCYIAYNMSKRCGWVLDVVNNESNGCTFTLTII